MSPNSNTNRPLLTVTQASTAEFVQQSGIDPGTVHIWQTGQDIAVLWAADELLAKSDAHDRSGWSLMSNEKPNQTP